MRLRDALDLCSADYQDDWLRLRGERPATAMVAGVFAVGASEPNTTILTGHTIAVYEPDASGANQPACPSGPSRTTTNGSTRGTAGWWSC